MFLFGGLQLLLTLLLCVHVVRTGQAYFWLWIIILIQPIGALIYLAAIVAPEMMGGRTARRVGRAARETLDPGRAYRHAKADYDDSPTAGAGLRLAQAAAELDRYDEAEALYRQAAQGVHADDPTFLLGRANALIELGRFGEALEVLQPLGRTADQVLALARALEGLGRNTQAEAAYQDAAERLPGLEAISRQAAFLARCGRRAEAQGLLKEIDRRIARLDRAFRKEGRAWRALAAEAIG
jgi:hypothetical protein